MGVTARKYIVSFVIPYMILNIKVSGGANFTLDIEATLSILEVKNLAAEQAKIVASEQRIFYKGKVLQDSDTLEVITAGSTFFIVRGAKKPPVEEGTPENDEEKKEERPEEFGPPVPCAGGCKFFGNPKTDNYCSKCFAIRQKKDEEELRKKTERIKEAKSATITEGEPRKDTEGSSDGTPTVESRLSDEIPLELEREEEHRPVQENKNRCWTCNKKIGLSGVDCRCGYVFCSLHRHAEQHNCDFDFKTSGRDILRKQNIRVVADKLDKA